MHATGLATSARRVGEILDTGTGHTSSVAAQPHRRADARSAGTGTHPATDRPPGSAGTPLRCRTAVETGADWRERAGAARPYPTNSGLLKQPRSRSRSCVVSAEGTGDRTRRRCTLKLTVLSQSSIRAAIILDRRRHCREARAGRAEPPSVLPTIDSAGPRVIHKKPSGRRRDVPGGPQLQVLPAGNGGREPHRNARNVRQEMLLPSSLSRSAGSFECVKPVDFACDWLHHRCLAGPPRAHSYLPLSPDPTSRIGSPERSTV